MAEIDPPAGEEIIDVTRLRSGWTTGACAAGAAKAATIYLLSGSWPSSVTVLLPKGHAPSFDLEVREAGIDKQGRNFATAGIIKDAGDDPDVTHGCLVKARVVAGSDGDGVRFFAGDGVGTVTLPGIPLDVGEPAINPMPRQIIAAAVAQAVEQSVERPVEQSVEQTKPEAQQRRCDFDITISVPGGEKLAEQTWNPRLGIIGGISILGTTGVVIPYSCSAWIHSILRGVDVAVATGQERILAAVGRTSEQAVRELYQVPDHAVIDMGDFLGALLKYLRRHPVPHVVIAGGFAKMTKAAQGETDLHSSRSQVDMQRLVSIANANGGLNASAADISAFTSAYAVLQTSNDQVALARAVADQAGMRAKDVLRGASCALEMVVCDRAGKVLASSN